LILFWLTGCDLTKTVLFVTDTKIAIDGDTKPPNVTIGYSRDETFVGPNFEGKTGGIPPVVGQLKSDLAPFNPQIEQLYATGQAAINVTRANAEKESDSAANCQSNVVLALNETKKLVLFRAGANIGLKVMFSGDQGALPESVTFGYKRKELSLIPLTNVIDKAASTAGNKTAPITDVYGSALAFITVNVPRVSSLTNTQIYLSQFFATGCAADQLAERKDVREMFTTILYDSTIYCIEAWLNSDANHPKELQSWWDDKKLPGPAESSIWKREFTQQRRAFIENKRLSCDAEL
jgi:hypothetical protein